MELYHEELARAGRDPSEYEVLGTYHLSIVEREDQLDGADEYFYRYLDFIRNFGKERTGERKALEGSANRFYQPGEGMYGDIEEMRRQRTVIGTPQQCIERMSELAEGCGLTGWSFEISYGGVPYERVTDQMQLFAEEVIPQLQA